MKSAHKVKAYRNNTDTAGKAAFLGSYLTKETIAIEKLCEQTAAQSGLTAIQVRAILEGSFDAIAELEKEGLVIVHLDGLTVMAVITGSFPTSDAPFDGERNALELAIRLDDDIRLAFVNETAQMVTDATMARVRIDNVMDLDAPRPMNIIHGVKPFRVAGFNMVMDDEGAEAYLQNSIGVTFPVTVDEVASTQLFTAHVAAAVDPGDYRLVVKSRGGDPEGVLQTTFRKVKCLAAAAAPTPSGSIVRVVCEGYEVTPDTLFDGAKVMIEGTGLASATGCTFSCKDMTGKEHSTTYAGTGSDFSASDTLVTVDTASIVSEMRSWCVEGGSELDTEAGATVKLTL
ncbi:MAG: hypothetical protein J6N18_00685, partial [Kiritimatiellae bacterium]|nr:hypothetical protein [Kiritimatiellia bacterium]